MFWTQALLIVALLGIAVYVIRAQPSARHLALRRLTVFAALIVGVIVVLAPGWLTALANFFGIGRGTDFLVYLSIVAFIIYVVSDYKKTVVITRTNTELARALTLAEARLEDRVDAASDHNDPQR